MLVRAALLLVTLLIAAPAFAIDYFVDSNCSPGGNGTTQVCGANGPWSDIAQARGINGNPCAAGDKIRVKIGNGSPYMTLNFGGDPSENGGYYITCTAGTMSTPWEITAFDPLLPPQTTNCPLTENTYANCDNPTFSCQSAQHIVISYLKIHGGIWCSGVITTVEANLPRGLTIHHNELTKGWGEIGDGNWSPIFCQGHYGAWIHHNYIHNVSSTTGGGAQSSMAGIKIFTCTHSIYEFNTVDTVIEPMNQSGCIDDKQDSQFNLHRFNFCVNVPHGIRIQNQIGDNPSGQFPYVGIPSQGTIVEFNLFSVFSSSGGSNCLRLEDGGIIDLIFRNNTCVGPFFGDAAIHDNAGSRGFSGIKFYNNIIMGSQQHVAFYGGKTFQQLDYNIWQSGVSFTFAGQQFSSVAAIVLNTPFEDHGQSMTQAAVQFVNAGANNFQLQASSPAQSACRTDGTTGGGVIDCGAYTDTSCLGWTCGGGAPPTDNIPPVISITIPTSGATFTTASSPLPNFAGTCTDNVAVLNVTWSNNRGGAGTATGTTSWSQANIILLSGANVLTATCTDTSGNPASDILTVTYTVVVPQSTPGGGALSGVRIR